MRKQKSNGELLSDAIVNLDHAMDAWCAVARHGQCEHCGVKSVLYEPWGVVELNFVVGSQNGVQKRAGNMSAFAEIRLHRDGKGEDGWCVATIHGRGSSASPHSALLSLARQLMDDAKRIKSEKFARADDPDHA